MVVRRSRRAFIGGLFALAALRPCGGAIVLAAPNPPDPEGGIYPVVPDVTHAWLNTFTNIDKATVLTEPLTIFFWAFVFEDEAAATSQFEPIATFYHDYVEERAEYSVHDRSVGRLGDERRAYFDDTSAPTLATIIRVGSVIQASMALALTSDITDYMADLLEGTLPATDDDPAAFIPNIADFPAGWEVLWDDPIDITAGAQGVATPIP